VDEIVLRGMAKWPDVPAVYGWLTLNRRGEWLIKGEPVTNSQITAFIGRNYERDENGRWFFQNGPQRVYVALDYTPYVYRAPVSDAALVLETHTGERASALNGAWLDEAGALLVETERGAGLIHDRDLEIVLPAFTGAKGALLDEDELDLRMERVQQGSDADL